MRFKSFKRQINASIVQLYRQCKEMIKAAERDSSDIDLEAIKDEQGTTATTDKGSDCSQDNLRKENKRKRDLPAPQQPNTATGEKKRGRPKMTASQKDAKKQARLRGEAIKINGYIGKDYEQVFDESGKAIGKKDGEGNFIPYKARGRPKEKG